MTEPKFDVDPNVTGTRSLLIWSQTRYRCATESDETTMVVFSGDAKVVSCDGATSTAYSAIYTVR